MNLLPQHKWINYWRYDKNWDRHDYQIQIPLSKITNYRSLVRKALEETKLAIFAFPNDKPLGSDGFPMSCYQEIWVIMKTDLFLLIVQANREIQKV